MVCFSSRQRFELLWLPPGYLSNMRMQDDYDIEWSRTTALDESSLSVDVSLSCAEMSMFLSFFLYFLFMYSFLHANSDCVVDVRGGLFILFYFFSFHFQCCCLFALLCLLFATATSSRLLVSRLEYTEESHCETTMRTKQSNIIPMARSILRDVQGVIMCSSSVGTLEERPMKEAMITRMPQTKTKHSSLTKHCMMCFTLVCLPETTARTWVDDCFLRWNWFMWWPLRMAVCISSSMVVLCVLLPSIPFLFRICIAHWSMRPVPLRWTTAGRCW